MINQLKQGQEKVIRDILKDSQAPYAAYLEQHMEWANGTCYVVTPVESDQERIESFSSGGFPVESAGKVTAAELYKAIEKYNPSSLFIEDPALPGVKDVQYSVSSLRSLALEKESYAVASLEDLRVDQFVRMLTAVGSWNLWGFIAEAARTESATTSKPLDEVIPASDIHLIFAEVYDGEGFIFWQRRES